MRRESALRTSLLALAALMVAVGIWTFSLKKMLGTYAFGISGIAVILLPDWEFFDRDFSQWFTPMPAQRAPSIDRDADTFRADCGDRSVHHKVEEGRGPAPGVNVPLRMAKGIHTPSDFCMSSWSVTLATMRFKSCRRRRQQLELAGHSSGAGKGKSYQGSVKVAYGFSLVKGRANHPMEDYHVAKFIQIRGQELGLFAIFDGHLGDSVAAYLQKHLFTNILKEEDFWNNPGEAISKAYEKTDKAILSRSPDLGRGGSTAVTAILIDGRKLWIANVGDSRAVLAKGGDVIQLSVDHEPNTERGSIENRGGFVSNMPGYDLIFTFELPNDSALSCSLGDVPRVNGQLAVSRAFGDKSLKSHLSSDPDIRSEDVTADSDLLILASDGLWKVMSNEEAVDIARKYKDPQAAARLLTTEAVNRVSKDDISCIVVQLRA
ncbi:hypothetical protein ZIOFF_044349 [Zingiber officinale]|uniref:protein-serine/threonine phosphatase n=1 Tax=Zingiber officinale TaxID=94328 RepID=A0A8J5KX70_ZINOF|nr:hypothetical protein ZIOFF_044349 [Zingiber officinale]